MSMPAPDPQCRFHPAVAGWFSRSFPAPTPAQAAAWPLVRVGRSTLVAAPTGSGKTLTAFLAAIDALVQKFQSVLAFFGEDPKMQSHEFFNTLSAFVAVSTGRGVCAMCVALSMR